MATTASGESAIRLERAGGVATITLDRPAVKNALLPSHFDQLAAIFDAVAANPDDRVLVLTGAGNAFCAGADLSADRDTIRRLEEGPIARAQFTRKALAPALTLHRLPKPTIAAVNGIAAGGGCNLALGCDIVFASESAGFSQIFVNRGMSVDYGGTWLLPRLIGLQRAKDLAFRGNVLSARDAKALGLVLETVADDDLMDRVNAYAAELASKPPIALSQIKTGMNRLQSVSFEEGLEFEADAQATCLGSADFREALSAWRGKRNGVFTGA